jgi:anaerobic ribonucleoside-triphosphate reductase activating protein
MQSGQTRRRTDGSIERSGAKLNLHAILPSTRANGPGIRMAIWFQGCTLNCPGCFNPGTHLHADRLLVETDIMVQRIAEAQAEIEGVTISGGEPMQQADGLFRLLAGVRRHTRLSILVFSVYMIEAISGMARGVKLLENMDVLIEGPYLRDRHLGVGLRGSANQSIRFLTNRYNAADIVGVPLSEIRIHRDGPIEMTGIAPPHRAGCLESRRQQKGARCLLDSSLSVTRPMEVI